MFKHSLPSIEKFAAYLDGNLSQTEMQQFSHMAEQNGAFHQLLDASSVVDETIAGYSSSDVQLPPEIADSSFEIPQIPTGDISPLVTLSPEPMDDMLVAAACAADDISMFSDTEIDANLSLNDNLHDETAHLSHNGDDFGGGDDISNNFPDDM